MAMTYEGPVRSLSSEEEELQHLRAQVEAKERQLASMKQERSREEIVRERLTAHLKSPVEETHAPEFRLSAEETRELALTLDPESDDETMEELRKIMEVRGIKNAFAVLRNLKSPHLEDDFHRFLVAYITRGLAPKGLDEKAPEWKSVHMTLYEIALPELETESQKDERTKSLKELVSSMEQFYAGMMTVEHSYAGEFPYFTMELAVPVNEPHLRFYSAVPNSRKDLFEKLVLSIFPDAVIKQQINDYNAFVQDGVTVASVAKLHHPHPLSIKDYTEFDYDPLNLILNAFDKIQGEDEGAALQIIIRPTPNKYEKSYGKILKALRKGASRSRAFEISEDWRLEVWREIKDLFRSTKKDGGQGGDETLIQSVEKKRSSPMTEVNIRIISSSRDEVLAKKTLSELEATFNQFEESTGNRFTFKRLTGGALQTLLRAFTWRLFMPSLRTPLSVREVTTLFHFPPKGIKSSPHLKQARYTGASAPVDLPKEGILLGTNTFRGNTTEVRLTPQDRLRHLYAIGQTGAGKTGLMMTLVEQDIRNGEGVCFIDPHGTDILQVLAMVPPERYQDVIYFDPAHLERPFGLNLLEYDPNRPEQKTFIVNELLMIFRRLYGDVPESMGPAFEQYFRNATQLVMEDPESGSTMLDIARVLSNAEFRNLKIMKSKNPIVNQFWTEIATRAEGEASLQNMVPWITNKFDDFIANDFIRPIVGQQESSFNFRNIMDTKKILLVNLSKGRLGEKNANLIGLVLVGKLFMAALSRADNPRADFPPFYLYIDEFQNITTDSIPGILSEARKYKLSLTIAHQFLKQIDEKIRDAVFGNVGNTVVFRVGEEDGEFFAKQFAPVFNALDFVNIENRNAYVRILAHGVPQKPFNIRTADLPEGNKAQIDDLRELSYLTHGRDRETVEKAIRSRYF